MKEIKKILFLFGGDTFSGAEEMAVAYIVELRKRHVETHCILNGFANPIIGEILTKFGISYTSIKLGFIYPTKPTWTLETLYRLPKALNQVKRVMSFFTPDVLIHYSFRSIFMLQYFIKAKHIYHVHDNINPTGYNKFIINKISLRTSMFLTVSQYTKNHLIKCGLTENKISVLYNGTSCKGLKNNDVNQDLFTIVIAGQIVESKGHHLLFSALVRLKKNITKNFQLKIFGNGDLKYINFLKSFAAENAISNNIIWCGYEELKDSIFNGAKLLILPSILPESFGLTIIEAAKYKVLVLASNIGAPFEIITNGENGYLFESNNSDSLYNKLKYILQNKNEGNSCIENNFNEVISKYNIENQTEKLIKLLNPLSGQI